MLSTRGIAATVTIGVVIAFLGAGTTAAQPRALGPTQSPHGIAEGGRHAVEAIGDSDEGGKPESDSDGKGKGKGKGEGKGKGKGPVLTE
ncbi:hypothetical protein ACWZHB_08625 [Nocardia sp. FBN12]|uniref:hypothetical protein n=1 Tax=Nocardia sp. FBN12 TaxID=3419766 RepID=UPI003CFF608F